MRLKHQCNRLISLFLVFVMVIGMMPVHAHAASDNAVDAAVIFTDLHTSSSDYKESTVKGIMTAFKNAGLPVSSVTSGGDAFSVNADSTKYTGDPTKITGFIRTALGNNTIPVNYVWSDHDRYGTGIDQKSKLVYGAGNDGVYGTADDGNYYIYSLSMGDLCTYDRYNAGFNYTASSNNRTSKGFTATVPEAIANFKADTAALNKDRPLLIVSHQPLFDNRNDNGWAADWCDAINEVASEMDVAFFYGHNHKYDSGNDYYYAKGSTMPVATRKLSNGSDWNYAYQTGSGWQYNNDLASVNKVLKFTHMCAGYLAPSSTGSTSGTTREGTAMAVTIYDDSIRFTTYNSKGIFTGNYAVDKTVTREFAATEPELIVSGTSSYFTGDTLDLTVSYKVGSNTENVTSKATLTGYNMNAAGDYTIQITYGGLTAEYAITVREKTFRDTATGITAEVSVPSATGMTVNTLSTDSQAFQAAAGLLSNCAAYDIDLANCTEAKISLPVPAGVTTPVVYHISDDGKTITRLDVTASAGSVSFTTGSFGAFIIGQQEITEDLESSVVAGGTSYEEKTVYVRVDSFENGGKYLIVGEDKVSNGNKIAYLNNSGSEGWATVSVNSDSITANGTTYSKGYIELSNANAVWTASGSASAGYTLTNNNRYIGGTDANTLKSASGDAAKVTYDASASRLKTASGTTRYLYYSTYGSENWKWSTSSSSSTSSRNMWIYKEVTVKVATSAAVTYTIQAENQHHVLSTNTLQLNYALLADGVAAELPSGGSYSFEVKNDGNGIIAGISDTGLITFNKAAGGCYVKIAYTWSEGTAYKYVKITTEVDPNACDHEYTAVTVDATCTKDGSITYTCACGDTYTEVIKATGHNYESKLTAPTCTEKGYTTYTCACGDTYTADEVKALGHKYESVVTAPTCTEKGYTTYTCACGDSYVADEVKALGHDYKSVTVDATCTKDGSITYTCVCGDTYTEVIKATGHNYKSVVTAPTCTEAGFTTYTCACGDTYTADEVKALGHDYKSVTVEATCTKDGSITYTCHCGDSYVEVIEAIGHDYKSVVTAPTCTAEGYTTYTCSNCDHSYTADKVAALGHKYESVVTGPTCTEAGFTTYTCTCGDSYVADEVAALGHDYKSVTVEATCIKDGSVTYTCHCGDSYVEIIKSLGHDYTSVVTAPTCTEEGYTTYTCTTCGHSEKDDKVSALGHDYKSVTVDATCTENGSITYTCHCGNAYTEVIKATGHNYESVVTTPTCTEAGYTTYTCHCGDSYVADEVAALSHDYKSVTVEATCTKDGSITYTCHCGDSYVEVIKAIGHDYKSVVTAPTCTAEGYTTYTCSNCDHSYTSDKVAALGHTYKSVVTAPTCTENGYTTYACACGDTYVADEIAALGHNYKSVTVEATCTEDGYTTYICDCGHSYDGNKVAALGHIYEAVVTEPTNTKGGYTTYTCVCGDSYIGDETEALENSIVAGGTSYEEKTIYVRVDSFENGGKYVLIGEDNVSNGKPIAYLNNSGSEGWETVSINSGSITANGTTYSNGYIELNNAKAVWTASGSASAGYTLTNNGRYIGGTDANTLKSSSSEAAKMIYDASAVRLKTASGTTRYLYYSTYGSENWKWATSINSSTSSRKMWIYKEVTVQIPTSAPATYTLEAADVQHILTDYTAQLQYALLADGVAAKLPSGGSYSFQVSKDANGIIAGISEQGLITFNNVAGSCFVKISYTWSAGSVYRYVKVTTELDPNACDHVYTSETVNATCTENGYTIHTCTACGDSYVTDEIEALGHNYKSVTVDATCTKDGSVTYTCACGDTYSEVIKATGHDYVCTEGEGCLIYTCSTCGDTYTEAIESAWVNLGKSYVLDTDGIEVGSEHKYVVVGGNQDYALTLNNGSISATNVKIQNNTLVLDPASIYEFYFVSNNSRERNTYLLTQDGSRGVYHVSSNISYGHDSKGYWYFGSSSNGSYQLYDYDNCNWYLNYGFAWGTDNVNRFAVSYNTQSVRLFKLTDSYVRLTGSLYQTVTDADGATVESVLKKLSMETSVDGVNVSGTSAVTADMVAWDNGFDGNTPGVYTASVTKDGVQIGTIKVTVTSKHTYKSEVVAATCTNEGYTSHSCTTCGYSYVSNKVAVLGHSYNCVESDGYLVYTCATCGDSYSEKAVTYTQVSSISSGRKYVLTLYANSKYYALSHENNQISVVEISVSNGEITSDISEDLLWNRKDNKLSYESQGTTYYLYGKKSGLKNGTVSISTSSSSVTFKSNKLKIGTQYLYYSNGSISLSNSGTTTYAFIEN